MSCKKLVEVCAIAFSESGGLGYVAHGDLQDLCEVIPGEFVSGVAE